MPQASRNVVAVATTLWLLSWSQAATAQGPMYASPALPPEQLPIPHASADGTVYLNDASLYDAGGYPPGMYAEGCPPCDDYGYCAPMYCPPVASQVPLAPPVRLESWRLYGSYLWLHPVGDDVAYAALRHGARRGGDRGASWGNPGRGRSHRRRGFLHVL